MLTTKQIGAALAVALVAALGLTPTARALSNSDRAAGITVFPNISVNLANGLGTDTLVRISNTSSSAQVTAKCFYVNANNHCTNDGSVCQNASQCISGAFFGACVPGWNITDFFVVLTREQPIGWVASEGLRGSDAPLQGRVCSNLPRACVNNSQCPGGTCVAAQTNAGTLVPPVPENPFMGELLCVQIDPTTGVPAATNAAPNNLKGEASITTIQTDGTIDVATYNAVGILSQGFNDPPDDELDLSVGGEYAACPSVLIVNHLFDGAGDPINNNADRSTTELTLVPCSNDMTGADPELGASTAQFLVFNEFEQRFSTSRRVNCFLKSDLSRIDTTQPNRSIFNAAVAGTVAGQTRIRPVGSGLLGSARVTFNNATASTSGSAAFNIHQDSADRTEGDLIRLP
jgi:hypothetical protein